MFNQTSRHIFLNWVDAMDYINAAFSRGKRCDSKSDEQELLRRASAGLFVYVMRQSLQEVSGEELGGGARASASEPKRRDHASASEPLPTTSKAAG